MIRYPLTIFLSAFLLFQVQPLVGKMILPWFGGSPAVWTACMLFFQMLLLGGYAYAHVVSTHLPARVLAAVHGGLLLLSLVFLPIAPSLAWKPAGSELPVLRILGLLTFTVGLPYFLLSTTGPLLQESFRRETGRTPYRLYSLSNAGSLLALLSYPFVFEPQLTLRMQTFGWSAGYAGFVLMCLWSTAEFVRLWRVAPAMEGKVTPASTSPRPPLRKIVLWLALAACGSVMLLATTNQLCMEVTSVPFLWVLPLSLYLLTFIICFDHERWYPRRAMTVLLAVAVIAGCWGLFEGHELPVWQQLVVFGGAMFICCMVCHGELAYSKPAPEHATLFYLIVSAGGALGGLFVAIVAPLIFSGYWEYPLSLIATIALALVAGQESTSGRFELPRPIWIIGGAILVTLSMAVGLVVARQAYSEQGTLESTRNFYGVLRVSRGGSMTEDNGEYHKLIHGTIEHGFQYLDESKRGLATSYYGHNSGVGLAIDHHPRRRAEAPEDRTLRIGVVGLGTGTLATYGLPGDVIQYFEINPEVVRLSEEYFTYRKDSLAKVEIILGDARLNLEQQRDRKDPQKFDILAIDAFSSDSIPMHLLTVEAVQLYLDRLKPDGILCIHISNRFLDLDVVCLAIAEKLGWPIVLVESKGEDQLGTNSATWMLLTKNQEFLQDEAVREAIDADWPRDRKPVLWTDDYGSLWQVMNNE
jgi:SAM-dependent methyltransferase